MPGQFHLSVDYIAKEAQKAHELGIPAVLLFAFRRKKMRWRQERLPKTALSNKP